MGKRTTVQVLRDKGFELSRYNPGSRSWLVRCAGCEALVISGVPTHEKGCYADPRNRRTDEDENEWYQG
jgi:hypothetical protein